MGACDEERAHMYMKEKLLQIILDESVAGLRFESFDVMVSQFTSSPFCTAAIIRWEPEPVL